MIKAIKNDQNKPRMELLPSEALKEIANAFTYGAVKYEEFNWANGFNWSRLIGATFRHLNEFNGGKDIDDESKLNHLAHAGACIMMLLEHYQRNLGKDDRHKWDEK